MVWMQSVGAFTLVVVSVFTGCERVSCASRVPTLGCWRQASCWMTQRERSIRSVALLRCFVAIENSGSKRISRMVWATLLGLTGAKAGLSKSWY